MVGVCQVPHANQDTQANIEAYHGAIKWWLKHDTIGTKVRKVDWLVSRLTNPVSTNYLHVSRGKERRNYKKCQKDCGRWHIAGSHHHKRHLNSPTQIEEPWHVMSQDTITQWYVVPKPYTMYAYCSCKWAIQSNLCKYHIAIILLTIDILESTFLEFCGTYSSSQKRNLDDLQFTFYG
jgi:hypothetical protein